MPELPVGPPVPDVERPLSLVRRTIVGRGVSLRAPDPVADAAALYPPTHGSADREAVWTWMAYGPWPDVDAMTEWIEGQTGTNDPLFFTITDNRGTPIGMMSMLNVDLTMRRLELGNIWYVPGAQGTGANTEVAYLMLTEAFERYHCRRVEWKCDSHNAPSRHAAIRLGFTYEGTFRHHMIIKGRNRDTSWYAMTDDEWPGVKTVLEDWLAADDPKPSLTTMMADGR